MGDEPEYSIDEKVKVQGWIRSDTGRVVDVKWIHHFRLGVDTWGYKVMYDNRGGGLSFTYVPEGYLRKVD